MLLEIALETARLPTEGAHERLPVLVVQGLVLEQVRLEPERLVTAVALVRAAV
jgi:hypothetical protein